MDRKPTSVGLRGPTAGSGDHTGPLRLKKKEEGSSRRVRTGICLSDRPSVISTGADLELEAGSSSDITLQILSARDVYPDEVVRDGQKMGSLRQRGSNFAACSWRGLLARLTTSRPSHGKTYSHGSQPTTVISIALQKEIYMQSNKKRRENKII